MTKITIGLPSGSEMLHRRFVESLMNLQYPVNCEIAFVSVYGVQLPFARNKIVHEALTNNSDHLLFIDADMIFPSDLLIRLLKHDVDIVNSLAFRRVKPYYPCIFKLNQTTKKYDVAEYTNGLLEVDACGMPAILIKTEVFKKMKAPYYYYRDNVITSDITFCENARKLGYSIWIDTDLKIGHIGSEQIITEEFYENFKNTTINSNTRDDSTRACSKTNTMASKDNS